MGGDGSGDGEVDNGEDGVMGYTKCAERHVAVGSRC